jgi:hypothetical protein
LVAVREGEHFAVAASKNSTSVNSEVPCPPFSDTALASFGGRIKNIQWASSIFDDNHQIAFVGIGEPSHRIDYSSGELDLLQEFTDYVSLILIYQYVIEKRIKMFLNQNIKLPRQMLSKRLPTRQMNR